MIAGILGAFAVAGLGVLALLILRSVLCETAVRNRVDDAVMLPPSWPFLDTTAYDPADIVARRRELLEHCSMLINGTPAGMISNLKIDFSPAIVAPDVFVPYSAIYSATYRPATEPTRRPPRRAPRAVSGVPRRVLSIAQARRARLQGNLCDITPHYRHFRRDP